MGLVEDWKNTLNLPQTSFGMRANLSEKEPILLQHWENIKLYEQIQQSRAGAPLFVLHDGPPYANGQIHAGHILNKILKDIILKFKTMSGFSTRYIPGWDCHGLPIEVQVDKELGAKRLDMSVADVHQACRTYASGFIDAQRTSFKRLGVLAAWDDPYITMAKSYEASILRQFSTCVENGLVFKGLRPVNWCTIHQTALAEAEVEYDNHVSPSIYVAFKVVHGLPENIPALDAVIWTTTPWTLPANVAISLHPDVTYVIYRMQHRNQARVVLIAADLVAHFLAATSGEAFDAHNILHRFNGQDIVDANMQCQHPFMPRIVPMVLGAHVTTETGTGCVHTATAHGAEDFEVGKRYQLPVISAINAKGYQTADSGPFADLALPAANQAIIVWLETHGALLSDPAQTINHRVAHCWRCHKPIVLRATEQWFMGMDQAFLGGASLRQRALSALQDVQWIPRWGEDRIRGMLESRPDWCLSRQRVWGVPLAIVYCNHCDTPFVSPTHMRAIAEMFEQHGAACWFEKSIEDLFGDIFCAQCHAKDFRKERDILDVWFDSGVSFAAVIEARQLGHASGVPIDLYLEGSDQHRGWFHSSLLCSLATRGHAPYRAVLTHGFVVDGQGKKISKSKGNFVDPFKAIEKDGAELMRLWAASEDYRDDIRLSNEIMLRLADIYRKIRNTLRYLLGNLYQFDPQHDLCKASDILELDNYMLCLLLQTHEAVKKSYEQYHFHHVMQLITEFCVVDLSAFYLDILKDRLYASSKRSLMRLSAQSVLYIILKDLLQMLAPILAFTAEEAWEYMPHTASDAASVHLSLYDTLHHQPLVQHAAAQQDILLPKYGDLRALRSEVNVVLEEARREKKIGASVEACVVFVGSKQDSKRFCGMTSEQLADICIVSQVRFKLLGNQPWCISVERAAGKKCARCWLYREDVTEQTLCQRCTEATSKHAAI